MDRVYCHPGCRQFALLLFQLGIPALVEDRLTFVSHGFRQIFADDVQKQSVSIREYPWLNSLTARLILKFDNS